MDLKTFVFNAARDGKLRKLKSLLDQRSRNEVLALVSSRTNGATPLAIASKIGHLDCAEYLVEKCDADIEQVGSVVFDGETIDGAPPLWCAAAAGHLDIVSFLLRKGANVNATTKTNSTPLRAACFDGHYSIVKYLIQHCADIEVANRHGHTCLMIACYKGHYDIAKYLIEVDADVNRKSVKGNTALHDCAESGSLKIMKLLLDSGAKMDVDSYGMTPLLAAAVTGHTHIVEYLTARSDLIKSRDKIDALELLGATYVDKKRDMLGALKFWKSAMDLRYNNGKALYPKPIHSSPNAAYENALEMTTIQQLDEIISDPDEMRMQALLVRERILGPAHPDTSYYIRYRGAVYADTGNFKRCITLWMYALDMQQKILEPLSPMTQSSFLSFAELFSFMMNESKNKACIPFVDFCDILKVFDKCLLELETGMGQLERLSSSYTKSKSKDVCGSSSKMSSNNCNSTNTVTSDTATCKTNSNGATCGERDNTYFHRTLIISLHFVCLLKKYDKTLTNSELHILKRAVHKLVRLNPRGSNGVTPLHLACSNDATSSVGRFPICSFPSLEVVQLLLEVGADPNAKDNNSNTPLHTLGAGKPCSKDIASALLRAGTHLDFKNNTNKTFESLRAHRGQPIHQVTNILNHTSLQCLAAKALKENSYHWKDILHPILCEFVEQH